MSRSREYDHLKRIYAEQEDRRENNGKSKQEIEVDSVLIETESKPPTDRAAEKIGVAKSTANKASKVVYVIDELKEAGQTKASEDLRQKLNHSVNGAYNEVKSSGLITPKAEPTKPQHFTLTVAQWNAADAAQRADWLFAQHQSQGTFNQTNDNIEWAAWSWNPVTGCMHKCSVRCRHCNTSPANMAAGPNLCVARAASLLTAQPVATGSRPLPMACHHSRLVAAGLKRHQDPSCLIPPG